MKHLVYIHDKFIRHYGAFDTEKYEKGKKSLEESYQKRVERAEKEGE